MPNSYETIMVFSSQLDEEATKALVEKFTSLIAANGSVESVDEWGRRLLAYEINDEAEGYYVLVNFKSEPDFVKELTRVYQITDGVMRNIVVRKAG